MNVNLVTEARPFLLQRVLRKFGPEFRQRIIDILMRKAGGGGPEKISWDDIQDAINEVIASKINDSAPLPDLRTCELSLAAFKSGDYEYAEDIVHELENRGSTADKAEDHGV